jgi:hypothetical protein
MTRDEYAKYLLSLTEVSPPPRDMHIDREPLPYWRNNAVTDAELLEKLAADIKDVALATPPSGQALAVADQMIHRASAALADVHAHAMSRIDSMREQLDLLEATIIDARAKADTNTKRFMQLVTEGEESIRSMEKAVARIGDHLRE